MHRVLHLFRSLKARVTLLTLLIVLASLLAVGAYAKWLLGDELLRFVGEQQQSALSLLSGQVTQAVQERQTALSALGNALPLRKLDDPAALHAFLQEQHVLPGLFNGGVLIWDQQGRLRAELQFAALAQPTLALEAPVLQAVLRDGTPLTTISRRTATQNSDLLTMVVPARDDRGAVIGALAGVIRLEQPNFLSQLTARAYGKTGHFFVIDPRQRLIFATSDKQRLMEVLPAPGVSPWIDRFMRGFEGTARVVNPHGVEVLVSVQQIPLAGWYATVTLSPDEALGLIQSIAPRGRLAALLLSLLCVALIWLMLRHQLAPMTQAVKTMEGFAVQQLPPQPLQVVRQDEIGQLVGGFNRLLDTLGQQQQVLQQSEMFQQAVLNSVTAEIAVLDHTGFILAVNEAWRRSELQPGPGLYQTTGNAEVGANYLRACDSRPSEPPPDAGVTLSEGIRGVLDGSLAHFYQEYPCHTGQQQRWASISVTPLDRAVWQGAVVSIENISERVQMQNQVRELAFYDPLTHLPNRRLVLDRLAQQMLRARRTKTRLALLFVDLDRFKPINDALGHAVGDWLLQNVALRIQSCLRDSDTPARIGGDEFVVVLPDLQSQDDARAVAEKIRQELARTFLTPQGNTLDISSSIGVAIYPDHALTEKDLLRLGDEAMYQAKKSGRNAVVLCSAKASDAPPGPASAAAQSFVHMVWQDAFACGHALMDQEHQALFALINALLDQAASRKARPLAFETAFSKLMTHAQMHFAHEEALLDSLGYADLDTHKMQHQALLARALLLHLAMQDSTQDPASEAALVQFLVSDLVTAHILHGDRAYFPAVKAARG